MPDLTTTLRAYAEGKLDPETTIEVDGLILRYVDGSLEAETVAEIEAAMEAHDTVAQIVAENVEAARLVREELVPALRAVEAKPTPKQMKYVEDLIANPDAWGEPPEEEQPEDAREAKVIPLPPSRPTGRPSWGLMAASIGGLLAIAGSVFLYQHNGQSRLEQTVAELTDERTAQQGQIAELQSQTDTLRAEAASLTESLQDAETAFTAASGEIGTLQAQRSELEQQLAALDAEMREAAAQSAAERDQLSGQLANLKNQLAAVTDAGREAETGLAAATEEIASLEADRTGLQQQLAALEVEARQAADASASERDQLAGQLATLEDELASATQARGDAEMALATATEDIASLQTERSGLQQQLARLDAEARQAAAQSASERDQLAIALLSAKAAQNAAEAQLTEANSTIEELTAEGSRLAQQVARLTAQEATLAADLGDRDLRLATLDQQLGDTRTALAEAQRQAAQLATEREVLSAEATQRQQQLAEAETELGIARGQSAGFAAALDRLLIQTGWLAQVAGYHRGYAGSMREVEITAKQEEEEQKLTKWLTVMLGRDITVPDLAGMTFIGGRLFFVNGWPVGQIAYHDHDGRLFGFCLKRNPTGTEQPLTERQIDNLYLIDWQDPEYQYVLIGFVDFAEIKPLAERLSRTYRDET